MLLESVLATEAEDAVHQFTIAHSLGESVSEQTAVTFSHELSAALKVCCQEACRVTCRLDTGTRQNAH